MKRWIDGKSSKYVVSSVVSGLLFNPFRIAFAAPAITGSTAVMNSPYDTALLPIKPRDLEQAIVTASASSPVKVFQLLRQADEQNQDMLAVRALKRRSLEQPQNAVAQASYALALEMALGWNKGRQKRHVLDYNATQQELTATIERARQLDPKLWLSYVVAGHKLFYQMPARYDEGLPLLKKAVTLAPEVAFTHYELGKAYILIAGLAWSRHKPHAEPFQRAAAELEQAIKLKPVTADARYALFQLYESWTPDAAKAKRAGAAFVSSLPPGNSIGPPARKRLAKYGVKVRW